MAQDSVFIEGMRITAHVGVTAEERDTRQILRFDLELRCDLHRAGESDDIGHVIDYGAVYQHVVTVVESTPCKLLEHLASKVAAALLAAFPACEEVRIRVGKPALFPTTGRSGMPGVEIVRVRSELSARA
ncbi:MAG: dihydroneopterin aldolase [Chloroflexota bacterium]|nr:dihydroneopterin aldolase [Chloroflexota bacterium]MDE2839381.1 dihydroneopterin aldolase [Chloroflexota bacterium]MDE2931516.1 dihydroneopterin aldolase [Chloroflexota bacterium]